jgi:uncharacterized protein (TIGR02145 family)
MLAKFRIDVLTFLMVVILFSCEKENNNLPVVMTYEVCGIYQRSASAGGAVIDNRGDSILVKGVCWSKSAGPTLKDNHTTQDGGNGSFISKLNGLTRGTQYYVRAYATSRSGTGYGNEVTFWSEGYNLPEIITAEVTYINSTSAVSGGYIHDSGGDIITSKGVCWSINTDPTLEDAHTDDGSGIEQFVSRLTGLSGSTTYYVRAYAINRVGTAYGSNVSFKTLSDSEAVIFHPVTFNPDLTYGTVMDPDWNVYKTIQVGTQTWMAENLRTVHFLNGGQIAHVEDSIFWSDYNLDAFCCYNNDTSYTRYNGLIYNWHAVNTGLLCPNGWHVPTRDDFIALITYLGGEELAGGKLKETETDHWPAPNTEADNQSGFTAIPAGYRSLGEFLNNGTSGYWWSSTGSDSDNAYYLFINSDSNSATITGGYKSDGMSVRCIKN